MVVLVDHVNGLDGLAGEPMVVHHSDGTIRAPDLEEFRLRVEREQ